MQELSLEGVLEDFFRYKTSDFYTALVCRVVTVRTNLEDQRLDVQPLNNRILPDGTSKEHSVILNVPVVFPSSKKASLTFPIDVGDIVLCVFSQRSTDNFKASSGSATYTAQDKRRFDVRDAIAIPGVMSFPDAINDPSKRKWSHSTRDLVIVNNIGSSTECEIRLKDNGNIEMRTDQDFYAKFNDGLIECNNLTIEAQGNFTVNAGSNISMTAGSDLSLQASTWNVNISGTTTVNAPTTNWTGAFNLTGPFGLAGPMTAIGGGGGGDSATFNMPINVSGGDVTADGISLKTHVHNETGDGGGTTTPPL
ncbi:MAG: putative spike protein [Prokaryotic dsDNA virus sp.]|jgi:phage baseplate assembly protein gpV|nr:MAG: putative spike protein [Prokaryotic dsDNA virus sp.]|tara:strand:- start:81783 stop:82709 length:927 start_codon:yes stop_codon:yes gene_type:complete